MLTITQNCRPLDIPHSVVSVSLMCVVLVYSLDEWVGMLKSTVMMSQKKLSDDRSVSSGSDGITVAYMLVWLLCIAFLRDTDHGSEVRSTYIVALYPITHPLS